MIKSKRMTFAEERAIRQKYFRKLVEEEVSKRLSELKTDIIKELKAND